MRILTEFSNGKIDILVGTQMIGKGFDFANLNLIVVMLADSLISAEDFRANEKAVQQLTQLAGRAGRRDLRGEMIIHTSIPEHIVYTSLDKLDQFYIQELEEREKYLYPPYIKIVKLTLKDKNQKKIDNLANNLNKIFNNISNKNSDIIAVYGPFSPSIDRVRDQHIVNFIIKIKKSISLQISKGTILDAVENEIKKSNNSTRVIFDVDPY
jgi:primosomal protein N' (replication factor Y)